MLPKETYKNTPTFYAKSRAEWRKWLEKNHLTEKSIWLIIYKKESGTPSVYYPEAVDEALCFGWIDSLPNKRDSMSYYQFFSKRKAKSNWSRVNKEKAEKLIDQGLMHSSGHAMIELAKQTGTWNALDEVEQLNLPLELINGFKENKSAWANWEKFSRSSKRGILEWIMNAKRSETRLKRVQETISLAEKNIKANHKLND
jgi:uncharacterized protein YdeI (YjbR/CyaY-like superfamily)